MAKAAIDMLGLAEARGTRSAPKTRMIMGTLITHSSTMNGRKAGAVTGRNSN